MLNKQIDRLSIKYVASVRNGIVLERILHACKPLPSMPTYASFGLRHTSFAHYSLNICSFMYAILIFGSAQ